MQSYGFISITAQITFIRKKSSNHLPNAQNPSKRSKSANHHEQRNMLLRPDIRTPWRCCETAIMLRLADGSIFMPLLLPWQAAEKRIHPRNTWASVETAIMPARS
jgi:hypothetical protein